LVSYVLGFKVGIFHSKSMMNQPIELTVLIIYCLTFI